MQYTEKVVNEILEENIKLKNEILSLKESVKEAEAKVELAKREAKEAREKYVSMAERCLQFYVTRDHIDRDTVRAEVVVPAFLAQHDLGEALPGLIIRTIMFERDKLQYEKEQV